MKKTALLILFSFFLSSCVSMSPQDPVAIKNATDIKIEIEILMQKAVEPYANHAKQAEFVELRGLQALEYARAKDNNSQTVMQWELLMDTKRNLLGGFLKEWKDQEVGLNSFFILGVKKNIFSSIDKIIKLEKAKL